MNIIKPSYEILTDINGLDTLKFLERIARTCYKSEDKITDNSAIGMMTNIVENDHTAMIEHFSITVKFICDRGVSHEIVRHRLCSFAQESTRYVNYSKKGVTYIRPYFWKEDSDAYNIWLNAMSEAEYSYNSLIASGATPQEARSVLPNSVKTEIIVTANLREWANIFKLRTAKAAHPQMREVMIPLFFELKDKIPVIFNNIEVTDEMKEFYKKHNIKK